MKEKIGYLLLCFDDWLAKRKIYLNCFVKDKDNYVNILCRLGYKLLCQKSNK